MREGDGEVGDVEDMGKEGIEFFQSSDSDAFTQFFVFWREI